MGWNSSCLYQKVGREKTASDPRLLHCRRMWPAGKLQLKTQLTTCDPVAPDSLCCQRIKVCEEWCITSQYKWWVTSTDREPRKPQRHSALSSFCNETGMNISLLNTFFAASALRGNVYIMLLCLCAAGILLLAKLSWRVCESVWAHTVGSQHTGSFHVVRKVKGH